ncbi:hypothetical protein K523DRAFT_323398 [Schizophyllum commune Tattone D]|nr:hypothetical protein K523DRAFT_323398 [Schizophyllum commune Tattone D]
MNIHNNLRPFACGYPGCDSRFNARSNALRHRHLHGVEFVRSVEAEQRANAERDAREARGEGALFAETIVADECASSSAGQKRSGYGNVRWMPTNQPTRSYAPYVLSSPSRRRRGGLPKGQGPSKQDQRNSCVEDAPR